jgi:Domain of unknown function (DUF4288)
VDASDSLYVAILINEISVDGPGHVPRFEESIVLLRADSDEGAERLALQHARAAETSYQNEYGETVRWSFRELASIGPALEQSLDGEQLAAGVEIYSRFFGDIDAYRAVDGSPDEARWSPDLRE